VHSAIRPSELSRQSAARATGTINPCKGAMSLLRELA